MSTREIARGGLLAAATTALLYFGGVLSEFGAAACLMAASAASAIPQVRHARLKMAVLLYIVTSVLSLMLTPRKLIAAAYVLVFGLYPIVKFVIESRLPVLFQLPGKLVYANIAFVISCVLVRLVMTAEVQMPGLIKLAVLWIAVNIGFIIYDIWLSRVIALLRRTLPPE